MIRAADQLADAPWRAPGVDLLVGTIEQLSEARSVEEVAAIVRAAARRISGADGVCFVLREGDECHYLDEDAIGPLWKGRRFPMSHCISGWAMLNRETAVVPDVFVDARIPHEAYAPTFVRSLVMTPVRPSDPLAAIGAYWAKARRPSDAEVERLALLARATATALENVRLIASLEEALAGRDFLIRELDHRVKNNLAAVRSIVSQTLRSAPTPEAFKADLGGRLEALLSAYELISRERSGEARLQDVLAQVAGAHDGRIALSGPDVRLSPQTAVNFQMAFHELATNAARHGALSREAGRVEVVWRIEPDGRLVLAWKEQGGPPAEPPRRKGFGLRLVQSGLAQGLGGAARLDFSAEGFGYELTAPLSGAIRLP